MAVSMAVSTYDDDFLTAALLPFRAETKVTLRASEIGPAIHRNIPTACKSCCRIPPAPCRIHRPECPPRQPRHRQIEPAVASFFRSLDDEISAIGTWYLRDTLSSQHSQGLGSDSRAPTHAHWGLAIWGQGLQDLLLFKCLALLTLHKKRTLGGTWDSLSYFQHKQDVYQLLRTHVQKINARGTASPKSLSQPSSSSSSALPGNGLVLLTPVVCLISFIEISEHRFSEAAMHIQNITKMGNVCELDTTQWALVAWNDLRYAMGFAIRPFLPCSLPATYLAQATLPAVEAVFGVRAKRRAMANFRHAESLIAGGVGGTADDLFETLRGIHGLESLLPSSFVPFGAKLAKLYQVEHRLHTLAADIVADGTASNDVGALLFITAVQTHLLGLASSYAPSMPQCRHSVMSRARSAVQLLHLDGGYCSGSKSHSGAAALIWALFVLVIHSRRYARQHENENDREKNDGPFMVILVRLLAQKDVRCRSEFLTLLQSWPEIAPWYPNQAAAIWNQVLVLRGQRWIPQAIPRDSTQESPSPPPPQFWYSGVMMFYG